jgi:pyrroloquinoline quinone biosynthesis protein D
MPLPVESHKPKLAGYARLHTDPVTRRPLLLYPEGVLELEETTAAILSLCKGDSTVADITARLVERYEGSPEEIARDVIDCLRALAARGLIQFLEP